MTQRWTDEMLDKLADRTDQNTDSIDRLSVKIDQLSVKVDKVTDDVEKLTHETKDLNIKFTAYQQSTQWVVQLAFSLIASATLTVIITSVFKR